MGDPRGSGKPPGMASGPNICIYPGYCDPAANKIKPGYCWRHYSRNRRHKDPSILKKPSKSQPFSKIVEVIKVFPRFKKPTKYLQTWLNGRYEYIHRLIMQHHLNRTLCKKEIVHHIDSDGLNNRLSNLEILSKSEHINKHRYGGSHE
jgi:hypothetical protein